MIAPDPHSERDAEMFTERCRRLLTEQPSQPQFTISRDGLELLVQDSERYGAQNAELAGAPQVRKGLPGSAAERRRLLISHLDS